MQKLLILIFTVLFYSIQVSAQETDTTYWKKGGVAALNITNSGISNYWQAGGINSRSLGIRVGTFAYYEKAKASWQNDLVIAYGTVRQGGNGNSFIKNDDRFELTSKYGYRFNEKLLLSGLASFRTQFFEGFTFDPSKPTTVPSDTVSNFLAPAYLEFGLGFDYRPAENLSIYYSPVNSKVTIVTIEEYRPLYIPQTGTDKGARYEIGSKLGIKYKNEIAKNILFQTNANFFMNYLENFGNVDVNWETLTTAKVNNWLAVSFATNLIYDDDIKFKILENGQPTGQLGPRTQFQHVLAIGLTYQFLK
ncbi:MAG: DUF3078 domain-containing protein [Bacteroidia bacterium]